MVATTGCVASLSRQRIEANGERGAVRVGRRPALSTHLLHQGRGLLLSASVLVVAAILGHQQLRLWDISLEEEAAAETIP